MTAEMDLGKISLPPCLALRSIGRECDELGPIRIHGLYLDSCLYMHTLVIILSDR